MKMNLEMALLTLSNIEIYFAEKKFIWMNYTTAEILPITKKVKRIDKWEFAVITLDKNIKIFMVYITALETLQKSTKMTIHP